MCLMRLVLGSGWPLRLSLGAFLLAWPDLRVSSSRYVLPMLLLRSHDPRKESVHQLQATDDALFVACHGRSKAPPPQIAQDLALSANCHLNLEIPHRTVHSPPHPPPPPLTFAKSRGTRIRSMRRKAQFLPDGQHPSCARLKMGSTEYVVAERS